MYKKITKSLLVIFVAMISVGVAYAAFADKIKIKNAMFTTGSADIKFLLNLSGSPHGDNLVDELPGPSLVNIGSNWQSDYPLKMLNNSTTKIDLISQAYYETANDPDDLRSYINVEIFAWTDSNNNGLIDNNELGESYGKKTIIKWKTEGISLGELDTGQILSLALRFSTGTLSDTKQGKTGMFDFEFESVNK